jgi:hypothetical protein
MRMPGLRYDPVGAVVSLIDEAHESLQTDDLADFLLRVRPIVSTLLTDPVPQLRGARADAGPSPAVSVYLGPISAGVVRVNAIYGEDTRRALVGRLLLAYVDEVAARPRGCAVPVVAA